MITNFKSKILKSTFVNRKLKYLDVGYTRVTDKGVRELRGLPHLSFLNLEFTQVFLTCNILTDIPSLQPVRPNGITKKFARMNIMMFKKGLYIFGMLKFSGHIYKC
ncbi:RNI-like protein [Gigaspora margarita]|uniref:RNI-like protein n=1 Tax=Gigaspora margarita TaxID=4874 RepID=A0A8H3X373_GIGMA|nr:RNI-like protein [Gigaspora margarita]